MAQNSLSWEKSSQSLEVNWDVWILTTAPCSLGMRGRCEPSTRPWEGRGNGGVLEVAWLLFCLPPQGCRGILLCEITHNTLTSSSSKMKVLSGSGRPRPPRTAVLLLYRAFKVSCICQHSSSEIELTITPLSHLFTVAPASARPQGHVPLHRSPVWVACSRCSIVDFIFPQWGSWPLSIVFSLMWLS